MKRTVGKDNLAITTTVYTLDQVEAIFGLTCIVLVAVATTWKESVRHG